MPRKYTEEQRLANIERTKRGYAKRKEIALTDPDRVPHGASGYDNWGCRCDECRIAANAERMDRAKRLIAEGCCEKCAKPRGADGTTRRCRPCAAADVVRAVAAKRRRRAKEQGA